MSGGGVVGRRTQLEVLAAVSDAFPRLTVLALAVLLQEHEPARAAWLRGDAASLVDELLPLVGHSAVAVAVAKAHAAHADPADPAAPLSDDPDYDTEPHDHRFDR